VLYRIETHQEAGLDGHLYTYVDYTLQGKKRASHKERCFYNEREAGEYYTKKVKEFRQKHKDK